MIFTSNPITAEITQGYVYLRIFNTELCGIPEKSFNVLPRVSRLRDNSNDRCQTFEFSLSWLNHKIDISRKRAHA